MACRINDAGIQAIKLPLERVVSDIFAKAQKIPFVTHDVIMEAILPNPALATPLSTLKGDLSLEGPDNAAQRIRAARHDKSMDVIGHYDEAVHHASSMSKLFVQEDVLANSSQSGKGHLAIDDLSKQVLAFRCAKRHEIHARRTIIPILQSASSSFVSDDIHLLPMSK